jgi:hypothetical protein
MLPRRSLRKNYFTTQGETATSDEPRLRDKPGYHISDTWDLAVKQGVARADDRQLPRLRRIQTTRTDSKLGLIRLGLSATPSQGARCRAVTSPPKQATLSYRSASPIHPLSVFKTLRIHSQFSVSAQARKPLGKLASDLRHLMKPVLRNLYLQSATLHI